MVASTVSVVHVEAVPVIGFVEQGSFEHDREARLLGLLPLPVSVPPAMISTNIKGETAILDPFDEPWRFDGRRSPL